MAEGLIFFSLWPSASAECENVASVIHWIFKLNSSCFFTECTCDGDGAVDNNCDNTGKCVCKPNIVGDNCDQCAAGFFGFPSCEGTF